MTSGIKPSPFNSKENENDFYAAFISDSYHVPGDDRSKKYPGHGYPAHSVDFVRVERFTDKKEMVDWVEKQTKSVYNKPFQVVKCTPMKVETKISVETL